MSDQITDRKAKLDKIRALGVDPYGARYPDVTPNADIRAAADKLNIAPGQICDEPAARFRAAGRISLYRDIGSLIFLTARDRDGELQYGLSKKMIGEGTEARRHEGTETATDTSPAQVSWKVAKLLDLGDIVGVEGRLGRTKTGELTLWADQFTLLSKALRPPPEKWHGLTDVEARYRRRYVDLAANPDSQRIFLLRARIIDYVRDVLRRRRFIEVETPVLQPIYGGAAARPFVTHHNTLDLDLFLRISPELYLKRCLVGGLERVYEFARCFRNEGISPRHNPEFTMLELYQAYGDYYDMMDLTEEMIAGAAQDVIGSLKIKFGEQEIDYARPWPRRKYADLFAEHVGFPLTDTAKVRERAQQLFGEKAIALDPRKADDEVVVSALFEHYVEHHLINPTFVIDYPAPLCPLTKRHPQNPSVALRFEPFINGMEIGNAYSELNDPAVQHENFSRQLRGEEGETMAVMDEDYVEALECGLPPAGGLGIGIDRLVMLLTGSTSIRDVLLFPLQQPEMDERLAEALAIRRLSDELHCDATRQVRLSQGLICDAYFPTVQGPCIAQVKISRRSASESMLKLACEQLISFTSSLHDDRAFGILVLVRPDRSTVAEAEADSRFFRISSAFGQRIELRQFSYRELISRYPDVVATWRESPERKR